ncbi:MAG: hypothetical protein CMH57_06315 [Myxococcales bacterium]|nr:hypothetical protein [Myxococcales bacterium]
MSEQALTTLLPTLEAIEAADVKRPRLPVAVMHQEANDLKTYCTKAPVRAALLKVGLAQEVLDGLEIAIDASREAQSRWAVARDRSKPDSQKEREARGYDLRSDLLDACRWNLRNSRLAAAAIRRISDGEGVADLIQDLSDIAALMRANLDAFDTDQTIDAPALAEQAQQLSGEIRAGLSGSRDHEDQRDAIGLRDRAATHLQHQVSEIRDAGRYAFRKDADAVATFTSAYLRRRRASSDTSDDEETS